MNRFTDGVTAKDEDAVIGFAVLTPLDIPSSPVSREFRHPKAQKPRPLPWSGLHFCAAPPIRRKRWEPPNPADSRQPKASAASSSRRQGGLTTATPEP